MSTDKTIRAQGVALTLHEDTLSYTIRAHNKTWTSDPEAFPTIKTGRGEVRFKDARTVSHEPFQSGLGTGIHSAYSDFPSCDMAFCTVVQIEYATGNVLFTWFPLKETGDILRVDWPTAFVCEGAGSYALVNYMQGFLLPSDWPEEAPKLPFSGHLCSTGCYMPWWAEVAPDGAYMMVSESAWDAQYSLSHPAGGPTRLAIHHLPTLGRMTYQRTMRMFLFPEGSDHVDVCRAYRAYADENGVAATLKEKAARSPGVDDLIGSMVAHTGIKQHVVEQSAYYDREHLEKNDSIHTFAEREAQLRALKAAGAKKVYLHLDGWGQPGYDNQHPDYLPACREAGGFEGLRSLSNAASELGYLFGLHDQYRDYYFDAATFDIRDACHAPDGTVPELTRWAGGRQAYLCATLAPGYVKRNFEELIRQGVRLQATYLDVFTCNEPDECQEPLHRMTRKECLEWRCKCFDYLLSRGILPSSEEVADWSLRNLVFCHWAPYQGYGVSVPLFNLVYHDCVIIPWMLVGDTWGIPKGTDGMLHALLNGGIGYVDIEAEGDALARSIERAQTVCELHERIAKLKMVSHEFLADDYSVQRTRFEDGTTVTVDFGQGSYQIQSQ